MAYIKLGSTAFGNQANILRPSLPLCLKLKVLIKRILPVVIRKWDMDTDQVSGQEKKRSEEISAGNDKEKNWNL